METPKSEFKFLGYRINKCIFEIKEAPKSDTLEFDVTLSGDVEALTKKFTLIMIVDIKEKESDNFVIHLEAEAKFSFEGDNKELLATFIGMNAPAVLYPYLRSYVTMLTVNASLEPLVLPTLNLSEAGKKMAIDLLPKL